MKKFKTILLITILFIGIVNLGFSQQLAECPVPDVKKGRLMNDDGVIIKFKQLSCRNDTVYYTNTNGVPQKMAVANIFKVDKTGNYAVVMAASLGVGALLGSVLGTTSWNGTELEDKKGAYIAGMTIGFTVLGGVIGLLLKKHKEVYRNSNFAFDFKISPLAYKPNEKYYAVGLRIRF